MGLDLWFQEDVARMLASVHETMLASTDAVSDDDLRDTQAYRQGFLDSLRALAVAFGVRLPPSLPSDSPQHLRMLEAEVRRLPSSWEIDADWKGGNGR
jgi:hypothetical protein